MSRQLLILWLTLTACSSNPASDSDESARSSRSSAGGGERVAEGAVGSGGTGSSGTSSSGTESSGTESSGTESSGLVADEPVELTVQFRDRTIDLEPFLIGQPYSRLQPDLEHRKLFYFEKTAEGTWLRLLDLPSSGLIDLSQGKQIGTTDWSKRSFWGSQYHPPTNRLFITSDEANDEHMNVYAIDLESGDLERLTENDYTYGWRISADHRYLAYLARSGETEPFDTCLVVRDLETGTERRAHCDGAGADRFTWCSPQFTTDNSAVVVEVQHDGQRNTTSLATISLEAGTSLESGTSLEADRVEYLTTPRVVRYDHGLVEGWSEPGVLIYRSAETGFTEIYRHDTNSGQVEKLTDFREELGSTHLLETDPPTVLAVIQRPYESEVRLLHAVTGEELTAARLPARVSISDAHGGRAVLSLGTVTSPFQFAWLRIERTPNSWRLELEELVGIPRALSGQICHVVPERITYPTFDLTSEGRPRRLHAFYLEPKRPPTDPSQRRVLITAFYGGENSYRTEVNILAAAGLAVLSPAPRGSSGFGAEFAALNDGDLGGDEIVDIMAAAEWLVREKGYSPEQIGIYGGSHGGYATLRCLTFPPETNGRNASFDFGFGWSHAGFSDILSFYESCNIPDWVVKEAGDPEREAAKLRERSPIHHVEKLRAPVLLTHGANDWRVPVEESRKFVERARSMGKPVHYVEFAGQGHGIRGFANQAKYYQAVLSFIESLDEVGE